MKNEKKFLLGTMTILVLAISSFTLFQREEVEEVTVLESDMLESAYVNEPSDFECAGINVGYVDLDSSDLEETENEVIDQKQTETSARQQRTFRLDLADIGKLILAHKR